MKLLWDTHTFLWFIDGSPLLSATARELIDDPASENYLSVASAWEIAIKYSLGKLTLAEPFTELIPEQIKANGIVLLPITLDHLGVVSKLPFHHKDPFDRLIIAQGLVEEMPIVSIDAAFDDYGVRRPW